MSTEQTAHPVLRQIRKIAAEETHCDAQFLERFASHRDEAAFAALVRRHGPMVLGVCRRVLRHADDAEDAFQATFLVLAQKAATIRKRPALGSWLYGVALRVARKARSGRRPPPGPEGLPMTAPDASTALTVAELQSGIDEELGRLPERCRAPLVLCYLQGQTQDEAARQLGWSKATLRRRLGRGRELLRLRLARRGLSLS